jgi:solute carrier family 25 phosphate transporter 23/24/25/41
MGYQDASRGGGKLSLASVGFAGPGAGAGGGGGYKELLVMALPTDDGLDGAKVAEAIGVRLPDVGGAVRVKKSPPDLTWFPCFWSDGEGTRISILAGYFFFS